MKVSSQLTLVIVFALGFICCSNTNPSKADTPTQEISTENDINTSIKKDRTTDTSTDVTIERDIKESEQNKENNKLIPKRAVYIRIQLNKRSPKLVLDALLLQRIL